MNRKTKTALSLFLFLCLIFSSSLAETYSGSFGANLTWTLSEDGFLKIKGNGTMPDFQAVDETPWSEHKLSIKRISVAADVTNIGNNAFNDCSHLEGVTILGDISSIGKNAFKGCSSLISVSMFGDSLASVGTDAFEGCVNLSAVGVPCHWEGSINQFIIDKNNAKSITFDNTQIHEYSDWTIITPSTTENEGQEERSCKCREAVQTRPIPKLTLSFIEGTNSTWIQGDVTDLVFKTNGEFTTFTDVSVDNLYLTKNKDYTATAGSTIITLSNNYLNTLSPGKHTLTVIHGNSSVSCHFAIKQLAVDSLPKTGDNSNAILWLSLICISLLGMTTLVSKRKNA